MTTKERLHRLIDELPELPASELEAVEVYLQRLGDPVLRAFLDAPEDDELETEEERLAVEEARAAIVRGEVEPWSKVRAELLGQD